MSLISTGSISLDSTFKKIEKTKLVIECSVEVDFLAMLDLPNVKGTYHNCTVLLQDL